MITASVRRTLVALATTAALLPAAPALAQTATPTPSATATAPSTPTAPAQVPVEIDVISDTQVYGGLTELTVRGPFGATVDLFAASARTPFRVIRTATLSNPVGQSGGNGWTLQPGETTQFYAQVRGGERSETVTVGVRRTVTIGVSQANGIYTFSGQVARAEAGLQVTIARLDGETNRVTGVASTTTDAAGRYIIRTPLPVGFAGYYALTGVTNVGALQPGRSRLYGLIVNTRPNTPAPAPAPAPQSITLGVDYVSGNTYAFSGRVTNGANVPVTLARLDILSNRLIGVAGGRTAADGSYVFQVPVTGTAFYQVLTQSAKSRVYGLAVPRPVGFR